MKQTIDDLDFIPWLNQRRGRVTAILAVLPLGVTAVLPVIKWLKPTFLPMADSRSFWMLLIQLLFILICFSYLYAIKNPVSFAEPTKEAEANANEAAHQFWRSWRMVWAGWLLLYLGLVIQSAYNVEDVITRAATHTLNNISSVALILCYAVLARITVYGEKQGEARKSTQENKHRIKLQRTEEFLAILWLGVALTEMLVVAAPSDHEHRRVWLGWFGLFSGCIGAVSMALLIGRLDSNLLGVPVLLIAALFLYSSIQPTFDEFVVVGKGEKGLVVNKGIDLEQLREYIRTVLLLFALIGKAVFFIVMEWLDSSGRLLFYMVKARQHLIAIPAERSAYINETLIVRVDVEKRE